jgi:NSS family neurotransmitter:Na+ symporter
MSGGGGDAPLWSSRFGFIMAAVGSAVGLGNIWKFPYMVGTGGGSAFVLMYLGFVILFTVPILIAELMLGRKAQRSPVEAMIHLGRTHAGTAAWGLIGISGVVAALLILSFYSVVAGWAVEYVPEMLSGSVKGATAETTGGIFNALLSSPERLVIWHTVFMVMTVVIVAAGVTKGIEAAVVWMMPALFLMLLFLLVYAMLEGEFMRGIAFMFQPDFSKITVDVAIAAAGQAFFSLSVGLGTMLAYGSYLPRNISIPKTALIIGLSDTAVAIIAGCAIFPIVFASGLDPGQGPGLVFVTLPVAFGNMPFGLAIGALFFVLLSVAGLTSSISLLEPVVATVKDRLRVPRWALAVGIGFIAWAMGFLTVFSFNIWSDVHVLGERTVFDTIDYVTSSIMLPLGGAAMAIFAGWVMSRETVRQELGFTSEQIFNLWRFSVRYVAPVGVAAIAIQKILGAG